MYWILLFNGCIVDKQDDFFIRSKLWITVITKYMILIKQVHFTCPQATRNEAIRCTGILTER